MGRKEDETMVERRAKRLPPKMSPEVKNAYTQIENGVRNLGKSIADIQRGLRKAERKIQADAQARIRALRQDGGPRSPRSNRTGTR
jgi:hypothetical protein